MFVGGLLARGRGWAQLGAQLLGPAAGSYRWARRLARAHWTPEHLQESFALTVSAQGFPLRACTGQSATASTRSSVAGTRSATTCALPSTRRKCPRSTLPHHPPTTQTPVTPSTRTQFTSH